MSIRKAVVAIIFRKDKELEFLVLHRCLGWKGWEFPKGGLEKEDKTEESAVMREIKEETGIEGVRIVTKLHYEIRYKYPKEYSDKYRHSETVQSVYLVRSFDENIKLSIEHDKFKWLSYEQAKKILAHDSQKKALDMALKELKEIGIV